MSPSTGAVETDTAVVGPDFDGSEDIVEGSALPLAPVPRSAATAGGPDLAAGPEDMLVDLGALLAAGNVALAARDAAVEAVDEDEGIRRVECCGNRFLRTVEGASSCWTEVCVGPEAVRYVVRP